ncbi:MAG: tRNA adenosine(34) deaminase TadA [Thermoleophilia bacterium]|nr:tRNA adenosine(34) deaminase TadA [Thermoleophilia bacterium]
MRMALAEARRALGHDDVPVGAVAVRDGEVVGVGHNTREVHGDPMGHAEITALRAASLAVGGWRLTGVTVYVTLEPCPMCAGAMLQARVDRCVYGAPDPKVGAAGSVTNLLGHPGLLHRVEVSGGILAEESLAALGHFFERRRVR